MNKTPRILIVKLSAIGDVVHTLPALNTLRRHFPHAHITWLVEEAASGLVIGHKALDKVLISRRKTWLKGLRGPGRHRYLRELTAFIKQLRSRNYDMVFDFQASLKGAVLIALARGRRKIGYGKGLAHQEGSYLVLNESIPAVSMEIHALTRSLKLLESVGIPTDNIEYHLPIKKDDVRWVDDTLSRHGVEATDPFIVINPMAKWQTKLWHMDGFVELADRIIARFGMPIVFTGSGEDRSYVETICRRMKQTALNLAGETDLMTLSALLQRARLMVTTDTGPMYMAAAVHTPVVALFGPTAPWRTGPFGEQHQVVRSNLACMPCFKRQCPTIECMLNIQTSDIMQRIESIMDQR